MLETHKQFESTVCDTFGITKEELYSNTRTERISWPRYLVWHYMKETREMTLEKIAEPFGFNLSSVFSGLKQYKKLCFTNRAYERKCNLLL